MEAGKSGGRMNVDMPFHVVIAGGGVAALETSLALRALAEDLVRVELIAPETEFTYRPLAVAEPFRTGEVRRVPVPRLVAAAGAALRTDSIAHVDAEEEQGRGDARATVRLPTIAPRVGTAGADAVGGAPT